MSQCGRQISRVNLYIIYIEREKDIYIYKIGNIECEREYDEVTYAMEKLCKILFSITACIYMTQSCAPLVIIYRIKTGCCCSTCRRDIALYIYIVLLQEKRRLPSG